MLRYYVQKTQDEVSRMRVAEYLRKSRDRVLDSGLSTSGSKSGWLPRSPRLSLLLVGIALLVTSDIDFDTFLNYFALGLLVFVLITLFYGIIAIHDVPYEIAKHRNHPHQDAIHAAGWVSLFTLHAIWPFLWIWAMLYRPDRGWGMQQKAQAGNGHAEIEPETHRGAARARGRARAAIGSGSALMELLLILTYAAICVAIFKIFRIPVNKWTLPTAVLGGIFLIGLHPPRHELQPPVHRQRAHLLCDDTDPARCQGAGRRGAGRAEPHP